MCCLLYGNTVHASGRADGGVERLCRDGFLPVKLFKRHLKATSMSLNDEDFANLVSQYGDETGRYVNYVEVMRQVRMPPCNCACRGCLTLHMCRRLPHEPRTAPLAPAGFRAHACCTHSSPVGERR